MALVAERAQLLDHGRPDLRARDVAELARVSLELLERRLRDRLLHLRALEQQPELHRTVVHMRLLESEAFRSALEGVSSRCSLMRWRHSRCCPDASRVRTLERHLKPLRTGREFQISRKIGELFDLGSHDCDLDAGDLLTVATMQQLERPL